MKVPKKALFLSVGIGLCVFGLLTGCTQTPPEVVGTDDE